MDDIKLRSILSRVRELESAKTSSARWETATIRDLLDEIMGLSMRLSALTDGVEYMTLKSVQEEISKAFQSVVIDGNG